METLLQHRRQYRVKRPPFQQEANVSDTTDHILNDLAVLRIAAAHRGDEDEMRRIDEDIQETCELLGQPSVRLIHGSRPGRTLTT